MILHDESHNIDSNGVGGGLEQLRKEEFELNKSPSIYKRILVVDDEPDIAMTFKIGLESSNDSSEVDDKKIKFEIYSYTDPDMKYCICTSSSIRSNNIVLLLLKLDYEVCF